MIWPAAEDVGAGVVLEPLSVMVVLDTVSVTVDDVTPVTLEDVKSVTVDDVESVTLEDVKPVTVDDVKSVVVAGDEVEIPSVVVVDEAELEPPPSMTPLLQRVAIAD